MLGDGKKNKHLHIQCCRVVCSSDTTHIKAVMFKRGLHPQQIPMGSSYPMLLGSNLIVFLGSYPILC